jgi:hypothetical protein
MMGNESLVADPKAKRKTGQPSESAPAMDGPYKKSKAKREPEFVCLLIRKEGCGAEGET